MPPSSASTGSGFIKALEESAGAAASQGHELSDGFPLVTKPGHRVVDATKDPRGIDGAAAYDFTGERRVFTIWRPWDQCDRCKNAISGNEVTLPAEGDYECPHTNRKAYKEILDRTLAGELMHWGEKEEVLRDGTVIISLRWATPKLNAKKAQKLERARRKAAD